MIITRIKRTLGIAATFITLSLLTACGKRVTDNTTLYEGTVAEINISNTETGETTEGEKTKALQIDRNPMIKAYVSVLENVFLKHSFPDGNDYGFDDSYDVSENRFAVYDIDQDGKDELIIEYTTSAMAGMVEKIYDFDNSTNTVTEEFSEFPNLTYYDNGVIEAGWSHNQGLAGEFWPYTLYQYDQKSDTYKNVGMVDAWDKTMSETNPDGKTFPSDIDKNGDGVVYYIMTHGKYELGNPVDSEKYNQWYESYVGGAKKVNIPFIKLNKENINSIQ